MRNRIRQIMDDKGMSQKTFASELCIAEATLSGIFNGRTRPTNQTIQAIHERFPEVNISWLMFDEGEPYITPHAQESQDAKTSSEQIADDPESVLASHDPNNSGLQQSDLFANQEAFAHARVSSTNAATTAQRGQGYGQAKASQTTPQLQIIEKYVDKPQRKIVEIRVFFDDGTYESFSK